MTTPEKQKEKLPEHIAEQRGISTMRQWRVIKRREFKAIVNAVDAFRHGCAYTPLRNGEMDTLGNTLESMKAALSVKEWGK